MIQRIQTIWLLLAGACAAAGFSFSFYTGVNATLIPDSAISATSNLFLTILTIAVIILALVSVFLYKNRTFQLRLAVIGLFLQAGLIYLYYNETQKYTSGTFSLAAILQFLVILFFFLAARGISRDSKIIKESNRLR